MKSLNLVPAREQVAATLRKSILTKELTAGQELVLNEVAQKLGVSNTPVREALQILSRDGLVQLRPNKQAVVIGVTRKHVIDFYETMLILEREAAGLACRSNNYDALAEAIAAEQKVIEQERVSEYDDCNAAVHAAIRGMMGNERFANILSGIWTGSGVLIPTTTELARGCHIEHKEIFAAICRHDVDAAKQLMEAHISSQLARVLLRDDMQE